MVWASMAGKGEGVARIVRCVVQRLWMGEAGAQQDERAEKRGHERRTETADAVDLDDGGVVA